MDALFGGVGDTGEVVAGEVGEHRTYEKISKGLRGIKVLLPGLMLVGVVCVSRTRLVINSL
ncbi:hypothetical protein [Streptomyces sp. NRRL F-2664]|uniref:hypothetical protein n=1 Tax=Streptomyces sp. NRRL F-2664 TaxID=1463842 RepID=UPI0004C90D8E|nr:hypothetical protein [Streptomyces sp. NRRL F-2664]